MTKRGSVMENISARDSHRACDRIWCETLIAMPCKNIPTLENIAATIR
jgi:hypothetical protein